MSHTPGPWVWIAHDYSMATLCGLNSVGEHDGIEGHVLSISPCKACADRTEPKEWQWGRCTTCSEADANVIAAAPEMLAVLNAARIMLKNRDQRPEEMKLLDAIKAVVAKAEGRP